MTRNLLHCPLFLFQNRRRFCLLVFTSLCGFLFGLYVSPGRPVFSDGQFVRIMPTEFPSKKDALRHTDVVYRNDSGGVFIGNEPAATKRVGVTKKRIFGRRISNNTKVLRGIVNRLVYPTAANQQIRRSLVKHLENCLRNSTGKFNDTQLTISDKLTRSRITEYLTQRGYRQRLPDVINIGAKKAGTTLMSWFMAHHPGIAHSQDIETHFFDKYFKLGLQYYKSRMTFASDDQLSFEKTPRYFVNPETPGLIRELLPRHVKFIVSVRDPIERAISDFGHISEVNLSNGVKNASLVKNRTSSTEGNRFATEVISPLNGSVLMNHTVIDTSIYAKHMERWLRHFPLAKFHFVDHAQLMNNPSSEMNKIERFLNLTTFFNLEMFNKNAKNIMSCTKGHCMADTRLYVIPKAKPDASTISKLKLFFEPHNRNLFTLIGRDFSWS